MSITNIIYSYNSLISWYPCCCSPVQRIKRIVLPKRKKKKCAQIEALKRPQEEAIHRILSGEKKMNRCHRRTNNWSLLFSSISWLYYTVVYHRMKSHISNERLNRVPTQRTEISYLKWHINKINSIEIKLFHKIPFYNSIIDDHHSLKLLSIQKSLAWFNKKICFCCCCYYKAFPVEFANLITTESTISHATQQSVEQSVFLLWNDFEFIDFFTFHIDCVRVNGQRETRNYWIVIFLWLGSSCL